MPCIVVAVVIQYLLHHSDRLIGGDGKLFEIISNYKPWTHQGVPCYKLLGNFQSNCEYFQLVSKKLGDEQHFFQISVWESLDCGTLWNTPKLWIRYVEARDKAYVMRGWFELVIQLSIRKSRWSNVEREEQNWFIALSTSSSSDCVFHRLCWIRWSAFSSKQQ